MDVSALGQARPWTLPWWKPSADNRWTFRYLVSIHLLALIGIILFPVPGWRIFLLSLGLIMCGGLGTSACYHRALAHRAVKLNWIVEQLLILCAVFNGSGAPSTWVPNHRNHHANSDTVDDVSSPRHGGFWWAHLRWVYQWQPSSLKKWVPDINQPKYLIWAKLQPILILLSIFSGYFVGGWKGFFWIGTIRLVYILHMQMFVNSLLHLKPGLPEGVDSSQNIWWLGPFQVTAWGENWHGNHHAHPASARFGQYWWQVDIGWYAIKALEFLRLAKNVRT
ncbi:MAG: fatty acid desaturase [Candidatus Zambryskibacteria bacterium]|nr:fatty acid desaturase [Candidatus Zambryskibacteria bacterium]